MVDSVNDLGADEAAELSARYENNPLVAEVVALRATVARVEALHVPYWTDAKGERHEHYVSIWPDDVPAGHECRLQGEGPESILDLCDPESDEHVALACVECRQANEDGELGYLLWPCPTRAALAQPDRRDEEGT